MFDDMTKTFPIKYTLRRYQPVKVILKRSDPDRRSFVALPEYPNNDFWVGTAQLFDTPEACVEHNRETIQRGILQFSGEAKRLLEEVEVMKKLLEK